MMKIRIGSLAVVTTSGNDTGGRHRGRRQGTRS
jgi:hypothetical protein